MVISPFFVTQKLGLLLASTALFLFNNLSRYTSSYYNINQISHNIDDS